MYILKLYKIIVLFRFIVLKEEFAVSLEIEGISKHFNMVNVEVIYESNVVTGTIYNFTIQSFGIIIRELFSC